MSIWKSYWLLILLFSSFSAHCEIYRCIDENGKINFKDQPCQLGASDQDKVKLKRLNVLEANTQVENYKIQAHNPERNTRDQLANTTENKSATKSNCQAAKRAYQQEAIKIKARCKKARDVFCDLPAEKIQFKWDWNFARRATDQQVRNIQKNGAAIYRLKQIKDNDCR